MPYRACRGAGILDVYTRPCTARAAPKPAAEESHGAPRHQRIPRPLQPSAQGLSSGQQGAFIGLTKASSDFGPRLLVLDEPTASLDPEVADRVRKVLQAEHDRRRFTVLVTSHNMADIERLCRRRVVFLARDASSRTARRHEIAAQYGVDDLEQTFLSIATEARR